MNINRLFPAIALFFLLFSPITTVLGIDKKSSTVKGGTSVAISDITKMSDNTTATSPTPISNACAGVVCQPCTQVCSAGICVRSGRTLCANSGACVDVPEQCKCNPPCAECTETCQHRNVSGRPTEYYCESSDKERCPGSPAECAPRGYCRNGCGGKNCHECSEMCDDGPRGKTCVPTGNAQCELFNQCLNPLLCRQALSCTPACQPCVQKCENYIPEGYIRGQPTPTRCVDTGNVLCPDGRCRAAGDICGSASQLTLREATKTAQDPW